MLELKRELVGATNAKVLMSGSVDKKKRTDEKAREGSRVETEGVETEERDFDEVFDSEEKQKARGGVEGQAGKERVGRDGSEVRGSDKKSANTEGEHHFQEGERNEDSQQLNDRSGKRRQKRTRETELKIGKKRKLQPNMGSGEKRVELDQRLIVLDVEKEFYKVLSELVKNLRNSSEELTNVTRRELDFVE